MDSKAYRVDWERRRLVPVTGTNAHCVHGSKLIEWCADCPLELDLIATDLTPKEAA